MDSCVVEEPMSLLSDDMTTLFSHEASLRLTLLERLLCRRIRSLVLVWCMGSKDQALVQADTGLAARQMAAASVGRPAYEALSSWF